MTSLLIRIWLLALVVLPAGALAATVTVTGTVTDRETGEPLQLVSVSIGGEGYNTGTITTSSGEYALNDVPGGRYVLRFSYIGYTTEVQTVFLGEVTEREVDVAMVVDAIQLQEVEVVGDRFAMERQIQTGYVSIGQKELMTVPSLGDPDPIRILQFMPGVQAASDISSGLYVRGGGPDQTLILLDQIPLYNPTHAFGLFSTFNADAIDRTTLYKGAYPAEFGGRLGAVLDVQNREGDNQQFRGKASLSTITGRVQAEGPLDKGSWLFGARRTYLEPLLSAIRSDDNQIPSYYFYDINGKLRLSAPGSDKLLFSFYTGRDNLRLDLDDDSFIGFMWGNTAASATFQRSFGPDLLGSVVISGSEYLSDTDVQIFSTPLTFANQLKDLSARSDLTWEPGGPHTFRLGFQASQYEFKYLQSFNKVTQLDLTQRPFEVAGYVQDEWRMTPSTNIRAGLRARYFSDGERTFLEPRLSVSQAIGPRLRLKFGAGLYNQVLQLVSTEGFSAGDFYVPVDQSAEPSSSRQAVAGVDFDISQRYRISVEGYYTDLQDLLLLDNNVAVDQEGTSTEDIFLTGGKGYATGVELFLERRMGAVTGWIGYTWGRTRRTFDELNQGAGFPPKYDRRHDLNLVGSYRSGPWTFGAAFVYATGQAFTPAQSRYDIRNPATGELPADGALLPASRNSARLLPYHRLDVNLTRDASFFGLKGQWFIQVFNLYSRRNEWFIQYDTSSPETEPEVVKQLPLIPNIGFTVDF